MPDEDPQRQEAIERLKAKRGLTQSAVTFAGIAVLLVLIWLVSGQGFFWPVFPIAGLGIALAAQAYGIWGQRQITEDDIQREMNRGG